MNVKQLFKNVSQQVRLRPMPWRIDRRGQRLPDRDDTWILDAVEDSPARVRVHNIATGHTVELASDNVAEWRSPGFLLLRCQLILRPHAVDIEPIQRGSPLFPTPPQAEDTRRSGHSVDVSALESLQTALSSIQERQAQLERSRPCPKCGTMTDRAICPNCRLFLR